MLVGMDKTTIEYVEVYCIECGGEAEIKRSRLDRARCNYSIDEEGTECGGRLYEYEDKRAKVPK